MPMFSFIENMLLGLFDKMGSRWQLYKQARSNFSTSNDVFHQKNILRKKY